ncbi:MAG TPA: DUF551 domain-containing protein [Mycoplasmatales bacterium]|nr:DUF551 domain-containing protein [Mycoplasmatales bacterium]
MEWINIKDQLPIEKIIGSIFIVAMIDCFKFKVLVQPLHYIDGQWFEMIDDEPLGREYEITHWMPLPSPPEDE